MSKEGREPTGAEKRWLDALGKADDRYNSLSQSFPETPDREIRADSIYQELKDKADRLEPKD